MSREPERERPPGEPVPRSHKRGLYWLRHPREWRQMRRLKREIEKVRRCRGFV